MDAHGSCRQTVRQDLEILGVDEVMTMNRRRWNKITGSPNTIKIGNIWTVNENYDDERRQ